MTDQMSIIDILVFAKHSVLNDNVSPTSTVFIYVVGTDNLNCSGNDMLGLDEAKFSNFSIWNV